MLSINQINTQIKLTEMWKAIHNPNYPIETKRQYVSGNDVVTRSITSGKLLQTGKNNVILNTFIIDSARLWNKAPTDLKNSETLTPLKISSRNL